MPNQHVIDHWIQRWAVPLLLTVVALRQISLAYTAGLSSWHGGGFGMFASIDRDENRLIEVSGIDTDGFPVKVDLLSPNDYFSEIDLIRIRTIPRHQLLQQFATQILDADLQESEMEGMYRLRSPQSSTNSSEETVHLQAVTVRVWRVKYSRRKGHVWYEPIGPGVEVSRD